MVKGRGKSSNKAVESASRCGKSKKEAAELAIRSNISSNNEFKSPIRFVLGRKKQRNRQSEAALAAKRRLNR